MNNGSSSVAPEFSIARLLKAIALSLLIGAGPFFIFTAVAYAMLPEILGVVALAVGVSVFVFGLPLHFCLVLSGYSRKWIYVTAGALTGIFVMPVLGIINWIAGDALHRVTTVNFPINPLGSIMYQPYFALAGMNVARVFYNTVFAERIKSQPPKMKVSQAWKNLTQKV